MWSGWILCRFIGLALYVFVKAGIVEIEVVETIAVLQKHVYKLISLGKKLLFPSKIIVFGWKANNL